MSDDEIIAEVGKYPAVTVILTGGEPSLWIDEVLSTVCTRRESMSVSKRMERTHCPKILIG